MPQLRRWNAWPDPKVGLMAASPDPYRSPTKSIVAQAVDHLLEATVVGSFSRVGFAVRSRLADWDAPPRLDGRTILVTGASSGIGKAIALGLSDLGARLILVGRDGERLAATRHAAGNGREGAQVEVVPLDLVDPGAVGTFADRMAGSTDRLHGLIHCAGALFDRYRTAPDGTELTLATHVLGPFRLTSLLAPLLRQGGQSVIVTMSSGGMYTQPFKLDDLELTPSEYRGAIAYARAKRAQVVLAHEWSRRWRSDGVASFAMHPGWVATPGLVSGLPAFSRLGPLLRTPPQGADTAVWLAATGCSSPPRPGGIWLDRQRRSEYYLPTTYRRPSDRTRDGEALWEWCTSRTLNRSSRQAP
jgi:dehydrogenase/reductase SDR family member 12